MPTNGPQPGVLAPVPPAARYLWLRRRPDADPAALLRALGTWRPAEELVLGVGPSLARAAGTVPPGLRTLAALDGPGVAVPSTPDDLLLWLRGEDRGVLLHRGRELLRSLGGAVEVVDQADAFFYAGGRDLSGYEDGTENPTGDDAHGAALVAGQGPGLDGATFMAVQRWVHDLDRFQAMSQTDQDHTIGRRRSDNEELADAPASAHVQRTAQESFEPPAFVVRRSMPWADARGEGLVFVAFGRSLNAFEALLRRMAGLEDGIPDALFRFTRPVTSAAFWCPPVRDGAVDLRALGVL